MHNEKDLKISVVTPSIRPEFLPIVGKCLSRQLFCSFEWLIGAPQNLFTTIDREIGHDYDFKLVPEPEKKEGDYYNLNKCWNSLFKKAKGELIVNIVDGLWFPPDTLEKLWIHYQTNPKSCVTTIGHQYDKVENGKPEHMFWRDPRARSDLGSFYEVRETEMELCLASFPKQAVIDIGGFDEEYDKGAACSEKEAMLRIYNAGYKLFIDQSIEYRAIGHPRIGGNEEWDKHYNIACELLFKHRKEIAEGRRLKLDYINNSDIINRIGVSEKEPITKM